MHPRLLKPLYHEQRPCVCSGVKSRYFQRSVNCSLVMLNPADAPIWLLLGYFEVLDFFPLLKSQGQPSVSKGMSRLGGVLLNCKRRRVILCAVVASWSFKETWFRCARACWLHSVRTGKEPCGKEMKAKSNSRGWKSKIGCLWESNIF